jgi:outer membrane protein OmpA-like peptidoglycan-associated protein
MDISKKASYYEIQKIVQLSPVAPGSRVILNNIFFDSEGATLRTVSNVELNKLFLLLSMNPGMVVEISYSVNTKENIKFNTKLAQDRAEAVVNYLIEKGINKERVFVKESGKLKSTKLKGKPDKKGNATEEQSGDKLELKIVNIK